jgi:hypothetical protein
MFLEMLSPLFSTVSHKQLVIYRRERRFIFRLFAIAPARL